MWHANGYGVVSQSTCVATIVSSAKLFMEPKAKRFCSDSARLMKRIAIEGNIGRWLVLWILCDCETVSWGKFCKVALKSTGGNNNDVEFESPWASKHWCEWASVAVLQWQSRVCVVWCSCRQIHFPATPPGKEPGLRCDLRTPYQMVQRVRRRRGRQDGLVLMRVWGRPSVCIHSTLL